MMMAVGEQWPVSWMVRLSRRAAKRQRCSILLKHR